MSLFIVRASIPCKWCSLGWQTSDCGTGGDNERVSPPAWFGGGKYGDAKAKAKKTPERASKKVVDRCKRGMRRVCHPLSLMKSSMLTSCLINQDCRKEGKDSKGLRLQAFSS